MRNGKFAARRPSGAKKVFTVMLAVVLLVGCSIGATLAWLTATTNTVKNTFTVGKVDITLQEHEYIESSNTLGDKTVLANSYKLIPGTNMPKDPFVTVKAGSEKCWVFVCVNETNNKLDDGSHGDNCAVNYRIDERWIAVPSGDLAFKGGCHVYYRVVDSSTDDRDFNLLLPYVDDCGHTNGCVDVNPRVTSTYTGTPTLTFTAAAVQYDGFPLPDNSEDEAANIAAVVAAFNALPEEFTSLCLAPATPET